MLANPVPWRGRDTLIPITLAACLSACGGPNNDGAVEAIEWLKLQEDHCAEKGGLLHAIRNNDPDRTLEIWLDRVYMDVTTGDRGHHRIKPGSPPLELGCSTADGGDQHWELVDARFISDP